jgi:hypothetical protein
MSLAERWSRFWFESEALRSRLTTYRAIVFGLLAVDMWVLMFVHAPRYGVAGFNVSHVSVLDDLLPTPTPAVVGAMYLLGGFLAFRVALGIASRVSLVGLSVIYGGLYLWSQADSYQHHYLLALVIVLSWFLPHAAMAGLDGPAAGTGTKVRSWAAKLIYVEVSIVYFYTAVTKTNAYWLDGWALDRIIQTESMRAFLSSWGAVLGTGPMGGYVFTAHTIMIWQFFVAAAFLIPKLRPLACITGPAFHILVEVIDLKIGWFSYYMIGLYYILLFPDPWFLAVARPVGRVLAPLRPVYERLVQPRAVASSTAIALAAGGGVITFGLIWLAVPIAGVGLLATAVAGLIAWSVLPLGGPVRRPTVRVGAQLLGVVMMIVAVRGSDALYDYHRYWAGDLKQRGDLNAAVRHYQIANRLKHTGPARYFALGELYERMGRLEEARRAFEAGLGRAPGEGRGKAGLARIAQRTRAR